MGWNMETMSIVASLTSIIIAIMAIILSTVFFINAKNAETNSSSALASIKAQTNALQEITARQLDRLTKHITEDNPYKDLLLKTKDAVASNITGDYINQLEIEKAEKEQLIAELVDIYLGLYFYCAVTNVATQYYLPSIGMYAENPSSYETVKGILDRSYLDFRSIQQTLAERVHETRIKRSAFYGFYTVTNEHWAPRVKETTEVFAEREVNVTKAA